MMIRLIICILGVLWFSSSCSDISNTTEASTPFPTSLHHNKVEIIQGKLPEDTLNKISQEIWDFIESLPLDTTRVAPVRPTSLFVEPNEVFDNAYYTKDLIRTSNYIVELYRSGHKYDNFIGYEGIFPIDYLLLISKSLNGEVIDSFVPFYHTHMLYSSKERFFSVKDGVLLILDLYEDETEFTLKTLSEYKLSPNGKFLPISSLAF